MTRHFLFVCVVLGATTSSLGAQVSAARAGGDSGTAVPNLTELVGRPTSELADVVERFTTDLNSISRRYDAGDSPAQRRRMREFYSGWLNRLGEINFDKLGEEGRIDYVLLSNYLRHQLVLLDRRDKQRTETTQLLPFADRLLALQDARRNLTTIDSHAAATTLASVAAQVDSLRARFEALYA